MPRWSVAHAGRAPAGLELCRRALDAGHVRTRARELAREDAVAAADVEHVPAGERHPVGDGGTEVVEEGRHASPSTLTSRAELHSSRMALMPWYTGP